MDGVRTQGRGAGIGGEVTDLELIRSVARGSEAALGALYDRHARALTRAARHIVRRDGDAEDVVHDAFVEAWQRAGDYDPRRGSVRAWLRVRVRSRALDRLRQSRRLAPDELGDVAMWTLPAREPALRGALTSLPPEQAQVLGLGYGAGLSCSEMARRLDLPIGTIKSRMAAGLRKLRECLLDSEVGIEPRYR